jgi:uncharacterized protein (AIM24 family)
MIKIKGGGRHLHKHFWAIDKHELGADESLIVDNYHLAALSDTCDY